MQPGVWKRRKCLGYRQETLIREFECVGTPATIKVLNQYRDMNGAHIHTQALPICHGDKINWLTLPVFLTLFT